MAKTTKKKAVKTTKKPTSKSKPAKPASGKKHPAPTARTYATKSPSKSKPVTKSPAAKKATKRKTATLKVYYVYRFEERFELSGDYRYARKKPLLYTKSYVGTGTDNESITYAQQINLIRQHPMRAQLRSAFEELKEVAANRSRCYRGYILDERLEPAGRARIALMIGEDTKTTAKILKALETIGLIEYVTMPDFDPSVDDDDAADTKPKKKTTRKSAKKAGAKNTKRKNVNRVETAARTPQTQSSGKTGKKPKNPLKTVTLNGKSNRKVKDKRKEKSVKAKASTVKEKLISKADSLTDGQGQGQGQGQRQGCKQQTKAEAEGLKQREAMANSKPPASPATTPEIPKPNEPRETDAGADLIRDAHRQARVRLCSDNLVQRYSTAAKEFGYEVFEAMKVPHQPDSTEGMKELASFASVYAEAEKRISGCLLTGIKAKMIKEAVRLGRLRYGKAWKRSPEAVFVHTFQARVKAAMAKAC